MKENCGICLYSRLLYSELKFIPEKKEHITINTYKCVDRTVSENGHCDDFIPSAKKIRKRKFEGLPTFD